MAEKTRKNFFETRLMRSKIKSQTVSLFPEAGLGYLLGPILALVGNGVINIWLIQYWDKVLGLKDWAPLFEILLPLISAIVIIAGNIIVGRLMERKPSLAGKARPLILNTVNGNHIVPTLYRLDEEIECYPVSIP